MADCVPPDGCDDSFAVSLTIPSAKNARAEGITETVAILLVVVAAAAAAATRAV